MFESEIPRFLSLIEDDPADPRVTFRQQVEALAWDMLARLAGDLGAESDEAA